MLLYMGVHKEIAKGLEAKDEGESMKMSAESLRRSKIENVL